MSHDIAKEVQKIADNLGIDRKRSIGEVAKELKVETHVIRFWEEKFPQIKPEIGSGKRRYYYNKQLKILKRIKQFLYEEGYTINGLQKLLKKRKSESHQDEDLDVILDAKNFSNPKVHETDFEIDDFIANKNVVEIDQNLTQEVVRLTRNARKNLAKLKSLLESN